MAEKLLYQIRINLNEPFADIARRDTADPALKPLADVLAKHNAAIKSLFDAFSEYVAEAEKQGVEKFPLYKWTKATVENPAKKAKHVKAFPIYINGDEVYPKELADALEADLKPLVGGEIVSAISEHDTNPANNPQPPEELRS